MVVLQCCQLWPNWITFPGIPFPVPFQLGLATREICMRFVSGSNIYACLMKVPVDQALLHLAHFQGSVVPMVWAEARPAAQNSAFSFSASWVRYE